MTEIFYEEQSYYLVEALLLFIIIKSHMLAALKALGFSDLLA